MTNNRAVLRPEPDVGPPALKGLVRAIETAADASVVDPLFRALTPFLRDRGVAPALLEAIARGRRTGAWDDAVALFGESADEDTLFFLGPTRASENAPALPGLLLAARDRVAAAPVPGIEAGAADLGMLMFGFPCSFRGRHVEFYRLQAAAGGAVTGTGCPIALFTPFYLGGWTDTERQSARRRTVLWSSVVLDRHRAVARRAGERSLLVDGDVPAPVRASPDELREGIGLWLTHHELFHSSGPLPLFEPGSRKADAGPHYHFVEEFRVDASTFLALAFAAPHSSAHRTAAELILTERLLRSARASLARLDEGRQPTVDGMHGLLWLRTLHAAGALRPTARGMDIHWQAAIDAVTHTLGTIYRTESELVEDTEGRTAGLRRLAQDLRGSASPPDTRAVALLRRVPRSTPVAVTLAAGPL